MNQLINFCTQTNVCQTNQVFPTLKENDTLRPEKNYNSYVPVENQWIKYENNPYKITITKVDYVSDEINNIEGIISEADWLEDGQNELFVGYQDKINNLITILENNNYENSNDAHPYIKEKNNYSRLYLNFISQNQLIGKFHSSNQHYYTSKFIFNS